MTRATQEKIEAEADRELSFTRVFDAPRELVYAAWTQPEHVEKWWGPNGFITSISEMDVRPGGNWRLVMRGPDGRDYKNRIVFLEVDKPKKLVYKHEPEPGSEPISFQVTVTFSDKAAKTEVNMQMVFPTTAARDHVVKTHGAVEGAHQTLGRLAEYLPLLATRELFITRVFDAPRELVFKAWTDPELLRQWWGPKGFTNPVCEADARPGGAIRIDMRAPDGVTYPMTGAYREVMEPERLVFVSSALDKNGEPLFEILNTVLFADHAGKTEVSLHASVTMATPAAAPHLAGMNQGWIQTLDRLENFCQSQPEMFSFTRVFDAPRDLVWKAVTEADRLKHWWGPKGFTMLSAKVDLRPGGVFHYGMRAPNGQEMWGKWVYREIVPPERLVTVVSFADEAANILRHPMNAKWPSEVLNTMVLTERDGKTTMKMYGVPVNATEEERKIFADGRGSMKQGFTGTLDQLEAYLLEAGQAEAVRLEA